MFRIPTWHGMGFHPFKKIRRKTILATPFEVNLAHYVILNLVSSPFPVSPLTSFKSISSITVKKVYIWKLCFTLIKLVQLLSLNQILAYNVIESHAWYLPALIVISFTSIQSTWLLISKILHHIGTNSWANGSRATISPPWLRKSMTVSLLTASRLAGSEILKTLSLSWRRWWWNRNRIVRLKLLMPGLAKEVVAIWDLNYDYILLNWIDSYQRNYCSLDDLIDDGNGFWYDRFGWPPSWWQA